MHLPAAKVLERLVIDCSHHYAGWALWKAVGGEEIAKEGGGSVRLTHKDGEHGAQLSTFKLLEGKDVLKQHIVTAGSSIERRKVGETSL